MNGRNSEMRRARLEHGLVELKGLARALRECEHGQRVIERARVERVPGGAHLFENVGGHLLVVRVGTIRQPRYE